MITERVMRMAKRAVQHDHRMNNASSGAYADIGGLKMYYEIHGAGKPLVLLHGTLSTIETNFRKILPRFAKTRQIIAIEQHAHGRTADIDRPLTYLQMAEDTVALLRYLHTDSADFFGYSMGGAIAMQIAMKYPDVVDKFVFAGGASYDPDGFYPELSAAPENAQSASLNGTPLQEAYAKVAPDPTRWNSLVDKVLQLDTTFKGWSPEDVQAIQAPALLIIGDSDIVRPEHTMQMFRLLGGGVMGDIMGLPRSQLAVLPGTTYMTLVDRVDWLYSMISAFLDALVH